MGLPSNLTVFDRLDHTELELVLNSFAGGENTIGEDAALKNNEARLIENWDAISLGGMTRSKGFNEVADGAGTSYSDKFDLLVHHKETSGTRLYGVIKKDLVYKNSAAITTADSNAFTDGVLCHAVSAGDALWITNTTDGLKRKVIASAIAAPAGVPTAAARIYAHKFRLIAEGSGKVIQGSRAGTGNWNSADTWSKTNDAWSITMPDTTYGCAPEFPSGNEILSFTKYRAYALSNFPDVAYRPIANSVGCIAPYSIVTGTEGVFFLSDYPKLGVFLFNGVDWVELTPNHDFVTKIDLTKRIFGTYRNNKYYIFYNEIGSGVTYPNRCKIYDTLFGRWMTRSVNKSLADNFGYPSVLKYDNNELYSASSVKAKIYELETTDDSDEALNTIATYRTKDFSSRDFSLANGGGQFPIDEVRMKLLKMVVTYYGTTGNITIQWTADRGRYVGSQTITMSENAGAKINRDFTVNTSSIIEQSTIDKTVVFSFNNSAVGSRFSFDINNSATGNRPKIKNIKIYAVALNEV
jgi:hypothetical protein